MSVRLTNDIPYLTGDEGQKVRAVFSEKCFVAKLERFRHCKMRKMRMRLYFRVRFGISVVDKDDKLVAWFEKVRCA